MSENSKKKVFWTAFGCAQAGQKTIQSSSQDKVTKKFDS